MEKTRSCFRLEERSLSFCSTVSHPSLRRNKLKAQTMLRELSFLQKMKVSKESARITSCAPHHQGKKIFIFGLGYVGLALARHLHSQHQAWDVSGTCSHDDRRMALEETGFHVHLFNSDNDGEKLTEEGLEAMGNATHMVTTIPPVADFDKDPVLSFYKKQIFQIATNRNLQWIGYLSSTGVYGDYQGEWVDENSRAKPLDKRGIARLKAEEEWLQLGNESGACVQVFRLGGIYGPGRSAIDTLLYLDVRSLKQRGRESQQFTSRIHVSDICRAITASIQLPSPGKIYNVVDNDPASRSEVFSYARRLICKRWPAKTESLGEAKDVEGLNVKVVQKSGSRRAEKRVSNTRLKEDLNLELLYPTYKSGLEALMDEMGG